MIDDDIRKLTDRDDQAALHCLEADIWKREANVASARHNGRRLASWPAAILVVAVLSSTTTGLPTVDLAAASPKPKHSALRA